jgi:hypothetical protein
MTIPTLHRPGLTYRGYALQALYAPPQWQVSITLLLPDLPPMPSDRQMVRGWNEEEVIKRAKSRVDELLDNDQPG